MVLLDFRENSTYKHTRIIDRSSMSHVYESDANLQFVPLSIVLPETYEYHSFIIV